MTDNLRENLDLACDGALDAEAGDRLERQLALDASLRRERQELLGVHRLLAASKIDVHPGFQARVMAALPSPAWARRPLLAFHLPLAMLFLLAVGAAGLLAGVGDLPLVGAGLAVVDFLETTALAGAGMLSAGWRGVGMGLEEMLAGSTLSLVAFAAFVLCLDLLFLSMLWRRRSAAAKASPPAS
jgi:hypothetical protein